MVARSSQEQLRCFLQFTKEHPEILASKNNISLAETRRRELLWVQVAERLNVLRGPSRSPSKWKESLFNRMKQIRCRAKKLRPQMALEPFCVVAMDGDPGDRIEFKQETDSNDDDFNNRNSLHGSPTVSSSPISSPRYSPTSHSGPSQISHRSRSSSPNNASTVSCCQTCGVRKESCPTDELIQLITKQNKQSQKRDEMLSKAICQIGEGLVAISKVLTTLQ